MGYQITEQYLKQLSGRQYIYMLRQIYILNLFAFPEPNYLIVKMINNDTQPDQPDISERYFIWA